jgi:UDP-N-acetylmuramoyl-tripeptide--D-alanyl-D-alanine ligase
VGADADVAACDLAAWAPPAGRGTRETLALDIVDDHLTVDLIDDAFNANPASVSAALEVLEAAEPVDDIGRVTRGRRIAILGDMLELGAEESRLHAEIAEHPSLDTIAIVHCVGPRMATLWNALPEAKRGIRVDTAEELVAKAHSLIDAGDVVLVKGSKGSRVSLVVDALRKMGHPRPETA